MKIAIIGYGKMGRMIENIARQRGHIISCIIDADQSNKFNSPEFRQSDVAIDFSIPAAEPQNILCCFKAGVPVVCGTTGWLEHMPQVRRLAESGNGTILWASNFSVGVNIFRAVNRFLARIMNGEPQYTPHELEVHHIHKLDHPSGTAVTLAEEVVAESDRLDSWQDVGTEADNSPESLKALADKGVFPVEYRREGEVPGIHSISWSSPQDVISITHSANSREGFALGAVLAAEFLCGKSGFFTIDNLFSWTI